MTRGYVYDGDGLLRSRSEGITTTSLLWDSSLAPAPLLQSGGDRVVYGLGPLYLVRVDGSTLTLARDGLGSVRAEVSDTGALARSFRYAAYGTVAAAYGGSPTLLGYTGESGDASGLIYLRARWYDPGIGRFLNRDAFRGRSNVPVSMNGYVYADGNPVVLSDPTGRFPPILLALIPIVWAGLETALSISDAVSTVQTLADDKASETDKAAAVALFIGGIAAPGGGGATLLRRARVLNVGAGRATVDVALRNGERWLGPGYKEIKPGVFRSADGTRQFRMTDSDILDPRIPHVNFEALGPDGRVIENAHVELILGALGGPR